MDRYNEKINHCDRAYESYKIAATYKVPHHSAFSGYEQLIHYLDVEKKLFTSRLPSKNLFVRASGRLLRTLAISRWYQVDGLISEMAALLVCLSQDKPVTLHYLYGDSSIGFLPYVCRLLGIRLVATIHSCPSDIPKIMRRSKSLRNISSFIVLGSNQIQPLLDLDISRDKIHFIPHGVSANAFGQAHTTVEPKVFRVLIVGSWKRNIMTYSKIISSFLNRQDIGFVYVSRSKPGPVIEALRNVDYQHDISDIRLLELYNSCDCMLMSAHDTVANNAILESMAAGLPIICEKVGAVCDYLGYGYPLYFSTGRIDEACTKIDRLQSDISLRNSIGKELYGKAKELNWPNIARQVQSFY